MNLTDAIADAFPIHKVYNYLYNTFNAWMNPDRERYIQTMLEFLKGCFEAENNKPSYDHKFGLVLFFRTESWKLIDNEIDSLFALVSSRPSSNIIEQAVKNIKIETIDDWKKQIQTIRTTYKQLQTEYKELKDKELALMIMEQPNYQALHFNPDFLLNRDKILQEQEIERTNLEREIKDCRATIQQTRVQLVELQKNLWESISSSEEKGTFPGEEKKKYDHLHKLIKTWTAHFQIPFNTAIEIDPTLVSLDEAKLIPVCLNAPEDHSQERIEQTAIKYVNTPVVKAVAIYPGTLRTVGDTKEFTVYYFERQKPIVKLGYETPQLSSQPGQQLKETRFTGEIKTLTESVFKKIPENPLRVY